MEKRGGDLGEVCFVADAVRRWDDDAEGVSRALDLQPGMVSRQLLDSCLQREPNGFAIRARTWNDIECRRGWAVGVLADANPRARAAELGAVRVASRQFQVPANVQVHVMAEQFVANAVVAEIGEAFVRAGGEVRFAGHLLVL